MTITQFGLQTWTRLLKQVIKAFESSEFWESQILLAILLDAQFSPHGDQVFWLSMPKPVKSED
jgi:hypothetical protein